ncbi:ciliogenesis and planar polarity effector 1 [Engraulis encrasicolus]|uniref:ciliogenesis and planar polarity effector 1 n=1 Tax=Engraulis encrasicolus TaxID=184585 RepID=UPI002FD0238A
MELKLEVLLSSSIKGKKPWPRFSWLGKEKEAVFLLDDKRICEVNMRTGRLKKRNSKLQSLMPNVVAMASSSNGVWLAGLLASGDLFLWNKDTDLFKTNSPTPQFIHQLAAAKESGAPLSLQVSGDGQRVLLVSMWGQVLLWECTAPLELSTVRGGPMVRGHWSQVQAPSHVTFPSAADKEASCHSQFIRSQVIGDACLAVFVFYVREQLTIVFLKLQWEEGVERTLSPVGYSVLWVSRTYPLGQLPSPCSPVKSRGALVASLSPDGLLLATVINQKDPRVTQVMFVSTQNFVCVSAGLGRCGSKNLNIPAKYIRSYWVASVCWSPDSLFLACVLKRGSLLMLVRLGELVTLSTTGCDVDFAAAHFLPIHPLITYRPPVPAGGDGNVSSSSVSVRDMFRQRYSVTWHPRTPLLLLSDGYNATLLRVPSMPTPTSLVSRLLWDTAQGLEQARTLLMHTQPQAHLESLSSLKFMSSLQALRDRVTPVPSLPLCCQDDGTLEDLQEAYEKAQADAEDDCPTDGQYSGLRREDRGSLELASMFDTLHAQPDLLGGTIPRPSQGQGSQQQQQQPLHSRLDGAQRNLLLAWTLMLGLGGRRVEQRPRMLKYAVQCASRLALLLQFGDGAVGKRKGKSKGKGSWVRRVGNLYRTLLSFLPWDGSSEVGGGSGVSVVVELSGSFTQLILSASTDSTLSSHKLAAASGLLQTAGRTMDDAYAQLPRPLPLAQDGPLSDSYCTPMLQELQGGTTDTGSVHPCPQRPSTRLGTLWQDLYKQALRYQSMLQSQSDPQSPPSKEEQEVQATLCLIQAQLQRAGVSLAEDPALHCTEGEELFLQGDYTQSTECWWAELLAEKDRAWATGTLSAGPRSCYLQTRYGLALLYSHLQHYQLREAQALADHMAHRLLQEPGQNAETPDECVCGGWPAVRAHREAACAVVQSLGRFMAAYFANQPLAIRPAHCVDLLDPLHFPQATGPRVVALSQQKVSAAVRSQQLSEQWTVGYALELLLIGGLLPEAVWLTSRLGDWTTAAALGLAYSSYCTDDQQLNSLRWKELHLPAELQPCSIFQAQLEALLGPLAPGAAQDRDSHRHLSEPVEEADEEQLCLCAQELLKASVMAKVDVLSHPIGQLLAVAKEMSSELMPLVPTGLYLPAPPLYCPQPSPTAQDHSVGVGLHAERACRLRVSAVVRKVLLLMRAARCALPAAQWYIRRLQRCHKNYRKIRKLSVLQDALLPEGLKRFLFQSGFFKREAARHGRMDPIIVHILTCFRELCALLWMLHVRDQLTLACRKYQAARNQSRDAETGPCIDPGLCEEAVRWACRLLPFSHFLCVEETLQDLLLSLLAQLPPTHMVAEILVKAFPEEEQSVRVALREKYTTLLNTLRSGPVVQTHDTQSSTDTETQQEMSSLLKKCEKQRAKFLARAAKHMTRVQHYLWERDEEGGGGGGGEARSDIPSAPDRLSLAASLSSLTETTGATLTSNTDAATPQALSPDLQAGPLHSTLKPKAQNSSGPEAKKQRPSSSHQKSNSSRSSSSRVPTPAVGSWEFELGDEEYLAFLELFLSYLLERAIGRGGPSDEPAELPLIGCFWARLRERELHSLGFDVLTTLKRRQRDVRKSAAARPSGQHGGDGAAPQLPVFQAGRSFLHHSQQTDTSPERPPSTTTTSTYRPSLPTQPWLSTSPSSGLWGSKHHHHPSSMGGVTLELSPSPSIVSRHKALATASPSLELQQELDPKLESRFPTLGRLLEWMSRWADRRVLLRRMEEQRGGAGGGGGGGAMGPAIRAKASAPAVLTSLLLLERRYSAALLAEGKTHMRVPAVELTVAPVLHPPSCSGERKEQQEEEERQKREEREKQEREKQERENEEREKQERENEERERYRARERERESSVDTGYPGSVATPIALLDMDPQQPQALELCELLDVASESEASGASGADSLEEELRPPTQDGDMPDDHRYSSDENSFVDELESPAAQSPSPLSTGQSGPALSLADLVCADSPERPAAITQAAEECQSNGRAIPEASNTLDIQLICEDPAAAAAEQAERILTGENPPSAASVAPQRSSVPPGSTHQAMPGTNPAPAQETDTTNANPNPVTQLVQDELFRLVQLQQINFMSLMQVVGASFANLPLSQARLPIAQSTLLPQQPYPPPAPPPPAPSSTSAVPPPTSFTSQPNTAQSPLLSQPLQTQAPQPQVGSHQAHPVPPLLGSQLAAAPSSPASDSQAQQSRYSERPALVTHQPPQGHHQQAMQILTISPGRPSHPESIPASQGLLTTVAAGASVLPTLPPSGSMQNIPSLIPPESIPTRPTGLRLLQLPPPQQPPLLRPPHHHHHHHQHHHQQQLPGHLVREAWGAQRHLSDSHPPPTQQPPSAAHRHDAPPGLLPAPQHAAPPPPAPPAPPVHGLPLLHLRPGPSLPQPSLVSVPARPTAPGALLNAAGVGPFPRLQLLQRGPDPPGTGRTSAPPLRTPRLIPLEQLVSWAGGGGGALGSHAGGPPLLKASMPVPSSSTPSTIHDSHHSQPGCSTPSTHRCLPYSANSESVGIEYVPGFLTLSKAGTDNAGWQQFVCVFPWFPHLTPVLSRPPFFLSRHRQRRREEREKDKERTGKKLEVSFRPEDSIIPPEEEQSDAPEMEAPFAGDGFVLPLGSCDSMLTGQRLLAASYATTAELHAYASTQKRPPELQDAGTNTDTAPPLLTDKSTSAQGSSPAHSAASQYERGEAEAAAACLPPELFLDLRFPREDGSTHHGHPSQGDKGRRFLNVIDLEDGALLQELSLHPIPTTTATAIAATNTNTTTAAAEPAARALTPAELHLLAATVNNNTHSPLVQQQPQHEDEGLLPSTSTQHDSSPPPSPPPSPTPSPSVLEECRGDTLTRSLLERPLTGYARPGGSQDQQAGGSASASSSAQVTPVRQASARLSEMDRQLAALQKIADQMDRDFADTRLLVRTIDNLSQEEQAHLAPVRVIKAVKSLAWGVPPGPSLGLTDVVEEEEEEESLSSRVAGAAAFGGVPPVRRRLTSHPIPTSSSQTSVQPRNATSTVSTYDCMLPVHGGFNMFPLRSSLAAIREQMMWDTSHDFSGTVADQSGSRLMDDTLGLSGLSDVADILGDLVRDGGLSPTALGLSHTQAARLNRVAVGVPPPPPLQQQPPLRSEQERRELRAWMRRKQRERLVEYRRQRDEWRAHERKPFISHTQMKPNSRDVNINKRLKEEKDKVALLEHHAQRTSEAYSLMSDLLTALSPVPSVMTQPKSTTSPPSARISIRSRSQSARPKSTSPASAKLSIRSRSQSAGRKSKSPGPACSVSSSGQRLMGTTTLSRSSRLGLHRPATALPADRMSQVTRRGILTNTKARADTTLKENQRRPLSRSPPGHRTEKSGPPRQERGRTQRRDTQDTENSENADNREVLSPWDPPLEIRRILGLDSLHNQQQVGRGTEIDLDALETLSVSSGSIMSKLNWEEIEKLVAEVEEDT